MPRAGSTLLITESVGTLTTKINRPLRVSTLTRMLNASPKNALVSPRVHHGTLKSASVREGRIVLRFMTVLARSGRGGGDRSKLLEEGGGVAHPTEDAALGGEHVESHALELGEVGADAGGQHQHFVPAIIGLADGGVDADLGGHAGDDQLGDARLRQDRLEVGAVEGSLAGLVDHGLPRRSFAGGRSDRSGRWPSRVWMIMSPASRAALSTRCSGGTTAASCSTSLPSVSPKPPGSRKSRCMSITTRATRPVGRGKGPGVAGTYGISSMVIG